MSAAASHLLSDFYRWSFPGAPIQIHLSLEAVGKLRRHIQDSAEDSGTFSGCGLLSGDARTAGTTKILNFTPLQTLDAASVQAARDGATEDVVGFYRTVQTSGAAMPDADRALADSLFYHPSSVFLLIEMGKSGTASAHFGFWGENQLFDWPFMPFPFDAEELAAEEERRRSSKVRELSPSLHAGSAQATVPAGEGLATGPEGGPDTGSEFPKNVPVLAAGPPAVPPKTRGQAPASPQPAAKPRRETRGRWLIPVPAIALAVTLAAGAFVYFRYFGRGFTPPATTQAAPLGAEVKPSLGLAVERRGNDLRISWNGNAPLISKADFGMLLIRGSQVSRDVPLTAAELRSGSVVYASSSDEVRFQLNVVAGEQVTREFLTVLLPNRADSRPVAAVPKDVTATTEMSPQPPPLLSGSESARELRQFKPVEDRVPTTSTPLRLDDAPPVSGTPPVSSGTPALLNLSTPPSLPAPVVARPVQGVPRQGTPPAEPPATVGAYPPVATNKVIPPVPALLRDVLWKPVVVEVTVTVDASGNIAKAEAVPKNGVNPLLSDAAVQAARRWKFRPAQFDGHPVPADIVLQFSFARSR